MNQNVTGFVHYETLKAIRMELYETSSISTSR